MEKGGKGDSQANKTPKSSLKSASGKEASAKGNDNSTAKSKRGRKPKFASEGSSTDSIPISNLSVNSTGKFDILSAKGGSSRGEKGGTFESGGKTPSSQQPLELKIEQELPTHARCIMDCEAAEILEGIQEQMVVLSQDPTIKLSKSFDRALQHAKTGARYTSPHSVRQILEKLAVHGVTDGEIAVIANVCPESPDEVLALVPSLKPRADVLEEPLKLALLELQSLRLHT